MTVTRHEQVAVKRHMLSCLVPPSRRICNSLLVLDGSPPSYRTLLQVGSLANQASSNASGCWLEYAQPLWYKLYPPSSLVR